MAYVTNSVVLWLIYGKTYSNQTSPGYGIYTNVNSKRTDFPGHSDFVVEKNKNVVYIFTPYSREHRILKCNGIQAWYKSMYLELVETAVDYTLYGFNNSNNKSYPEILLDRLKSNDFNQYDFAISKFDPLDRSLYDKYDSIEFGNKIIKK